MSVERQQQQRLAATSTKRRTVTAGRCRRKWRKVRRRLSHRWNLSSVALHRVFARHLRHDAAFICASPRSSFCHAHGYLCGQSRPSCASFWRAEKSLRLRCWLPHLTRGAISHAAVRIGTSTSRFTVRHAASLARFTAACCGKAHVLCGIVIAANKGVASSSRSARVSRIIINQWRRGIASGVIVHKRHRIVGHRAYRSSMLARQCYRGARNHRRRSISVLHRGAITSVREMFIKHRCAHLI